MIAGILIYIIFGFICYVASVSVWLLVLSRIDVGLAYPSMSLGYVATAIAAYFLFNEPLSAMRVAGIFVIMLGVFVISRT